MCTIELSVDVLWKFLETAVPNENDRLSNEWWMRQLPKNLTCKSEKKLMFQIKKIKTQQPEEWDISVLAFAILNHPYLVKGKQKDAVKKMKCKRDDLYHRRCFTYNEREFDQLFVDLPLLYKSLLGDSEAQYFCEKLMNIKKSKFSSRKALEYVN